ncbi:MAG TPA: hypothetical protein VK404_20310, partial [Spirosoma sp.]|nr:hypothetical protein [Spirosoma sp.]
PAHWSKTKVCHIWLSTHQFVYQNVLAGNISQLDYCLSPLNGWTNLSKQFSPITFRNHEQNQAQLS